MAIVPVILAGGSGTRLWPAAGEGAPKQFRTFDGADSMLLQTMGRLRGDPRFAAPIIVTGDDHREQLLADLEADAVTALIFEPVRRNTAAAVSATALVAQRMFGAGAILAILPVDHDVKDAIAFRNTLTRAADAARSGAIAIVGITPRGAETGYGYIELGETIGQAARVVRFVEKPDAKTAQAFASNAAFAWNAGIVVATAATLVAEMEKHCPAILTSVRSAVEKAEKTGESYLLDEAAFAQAEPISLDYALLEKSENVLALRGDFAWCDLGSWDAQWSAREPDANGNVLAGNIRAEDCSGSYLRSDSGTIAAIGLSNMMVIQSEGQVLVAPMQRAQEVGRLTADLGRPGRIERPWGYMDYLQAGEGFQVKRLVVKPGGSTSLQLHHRRAEHMTVASGQARIVRDGEVHDLGVGQSIDIARGVKHRLENAGTEDVHLIEVWFGDYLGEDDIVRFEDRYGRC